MGSLGLVAAVFAGLGTALGIYGAGRLVVGPRERVRARLVSIAGGGATAAIVVDETLLRRDTSSSPLGKLFSRGEGADKTRKLLERADLPLLPHEYFTMRMVAALIGLGVAYVAASFAVGGVIQTLAAAGGAFIGFWLPGWYARGRVSKRSAMIEEQLVEMLELMASSMGAGFGYMQALVVTAQQLEPPLSTEIMKMVDEVNLGGDTDVALEDLAERLQSKDFDIVSTAIQIQRQAGGNLGEMLRQVALTIRARQSFKRDVEALTAKEKQTAKIMTGFPLLIIFGLMFMASDTFTRLLTQTAGQIAFGVALTLDTIAYVVISKMTKIEV